MEKEMEYSGYSASCEQSKIDMDKGYESFSTSAVHQQSKIAKEMEFYSFSTSQFSEKENGMASFYSDDDPSYEVEVKTRKKGGIITIPFILANEAFEKTASYGLLPNMILYLIKGYHMSFAEGNRMLFLWSAATNFLPIVGAFLADSYLGRFLTISLGCFFSLMGMILLWLTAMIPKVKPPPCASIRQCKSATTGQYFFLISSFAVMSIGAGGVRSSSLAFGADQVDDKNNPNNERVLESYFGWYYAATAFSVLLAFTAIVYIQDHFGFRVGFGIPVILMFLSALLFFLAAPLYIKHRANESLFTGLAQVIVAAYKNRKLAFPPPESGWYHHEKGSQYTLPTDKLRFLNKACIIRSIEDVTSFGVATNPWRLCTVKQVEELKALIKVIPLWSTGIMMSINTSQSTVSLIQANTMDRHIISSFQIPPGSISMFLILTVTIWVLLYDRAILPLASKIRGKPVKFGTKSRMGAGLFFSALAMTVAGFVEHIRRQKAIDQGLVNNPKALVGMSAMWLVPQFIIAGLAEALNAIGQIEFYYSEFPKSLASVSSSLFGVGMGAANLLATVILSAVEKYTKKDGGESWVASNVNKGHYDYYYWLLGIMSFVNLFYFFICSWAYGPCGEDMKKDDEIEGVEGEGRSILRTPGTPIRPGTPLRVMAA
ncbi:OLC1v1014808C1 [Oldenlandia corymbosa var. corymbosa]|uniref:OLC1v1014808C1 n=1 Tax=Oldenlandia corymbosa var. corymbosa TaxID=529605 RepID=A0AAV1E5I3_OLDCO|nr:OLC1v1014808C1 [Oldenlandia corymbosa var. corymbosa]